MYIFCILWKLKIQKYVQLRAKYILIINPTSFDLSLYLNCLPRNVTWTFLEGEIEANRTCTLYIWQIFGFLNEEESFVGQGICEAFLHVTLSGRHDRKVVGGGGYPILPPPPLHHVFVAPSLYIFSLYILLLCISLV